MSAKIIESATTLILHSATARELQFKYRNINRLFYVVVDSLLGVLILHFFIDYNVFGYLPIFTNKTVETLDFVIEWILHHPAGLKLNTQLNDVLAAFFRGHIQLWKGELVNTFK
jgi:hypothetical protein